MREFKPVSASEGENLKETLKRCPDGTLEALLEYRADGNLESLSAFLIGCIKRHTDEEYQSCLDEGGDTVSFIDDLGIDSMTMMEIVMMVEECLEIQIDNQDLMNLQTIGDLNTYIKKVL
jgi:3-hydroxyacyl-[acyl-carrier-protein] dehydratase